MKKVLSISIISAIITAFTAATIINSKADMKVETADFSVQSDRSHHPSAYCKYSDGTDVLWEHSYSGSFCIPGNSDNTINMMYADGIPAYCIGRHSQKAPVISMITDKCTDVPADDPAYQAIFSAAAAGASTGTTVYGLNNEDLYYVTQCAIRTIIYGLSADTFAFYDADGNYNQALTDEYRRIMAESETVIQKNEKYLYINDENTNAEPVLIDDKYYFRYGPYTPYTEGFNMDEYYISSLNDSDIFFSENPEISSYDYTQNFNTGSSFYVFVNSEYEDTIEISVNTQTYEKVYEPCVYLTHDDEYQNISNIKIYDDMKIISSDFTIENTSIGDMVLEKKFIADNKEIIDPILVSQPRFTVINEEGLYVNGIFSNGYILFNGFSTEPVEFSLDLIESSFIIKGLPLGKYIINETQGSDEYIADSDSVSFDNTPVTDVVEFINRHEETTTTTIITTTEETTTSISTTETTSESSATSISTEESTSESITTEMTTPVSETVTTTDTEIEFTFTTPFETNIIVTDATVKMTTPVQNKTFVTTPAYTRQRLSQSPATGDNGIQKLAVITAISSVILYACSVKNKRK